MLDLSVRIMAHDKRRAWAEELSRELDAPITWDTDNTTWHTARRALLSGTGDYVLCVQDDAVPSEGLVESVTNAIQYADGDPICLYSQATKRLQEVERLNPVTWWKGLGPLYGVAVALPTQDIPGIVRVGDVYKGPSYDRRLWMWYSAHNRECRYTYPSLVEHRGVDSLMWAAKRKDRPAHSFGSGLGLDWSVPPLRTTPDDLYPKVTLELGARVVSVRKHSSIYRRRLQGGWQEKTPG